MITGWPFAVRMPVTAGGTDVLQKGLGLSDLTDTERLALARALELCQVAIKGTVAITLVVPKLPSKVSIFSDAPPLAKNITSAVDIRTATSPASPTQYYAQVRFL